MTSPSIIYQDVPLIQLHAKIIGVPADILDLDLVQLNAGPEVGIKTAKKGLKNDSLQLLFTKLKSEAAPSFFWTNKFEISFKILERILNNSSKILA